MSLTPIFILGGLVIFSWLFLWYWQRQRLGYIPQTDNLSNQTGLSNNRDAVLLASEHGRLLHVNERARDWFDLGDGEPNLEFLVREVDPQDSFFALFLGETRAAFKLNDRWYEATSNRVPAGTDNNLLIVIRESRGDITSTGAIDLSEAIKITTQINETINVGMGVNQVLQTLLTILQQSIPADAGEICLWKPDEKALYPQGWVGDVAYVLALAEAGGNYALGEGIAGWVAENRQSVLIIDSAADVAVKPKLVNSGFHAYIAVPLEMGDRFIGTLEFAAQVPGTFISAHMALMQAVSKQVATAIYNAELYSEQVDRIQDITSLQDITRAAESVEAVYAALTERIAHLMSAKVAGVLLYDERRRGLVAEPPFYGLPRELVSSYEIPLEVGSPAQQVFLQQDYWLSNDLAGEENAALLRFDVLNAAAGVNNALFIPLRIGDRRTGALIIGSKQTHGGFTSADVQNAQVLAAQSAIIVENLRLYRSEQRRDDELTGLHELTNAISALSHEGEFYSSLNERIARLMEVAICGILLYDEQEGRLVAQLPFYGIGDEAAAVFNMEIRPNTPFETIWHDEDYWYTNFVTSDPVIFEAGLTDEAQAFGITQLMFAPLSASGQRIGMVQAANKLNNEPFTNNDARLLLIFATQAAGLIQNARLYREIVRRAEEAESIRQVAEMAGRVLTADDSLTPVLAEISKLLVSPLVFVKVFVQQLGEMVIYPRNVYGADLSEPIHRSVYPEEIEPGRASTDQATVCNSTQDDEATRRIYYPVIEALDLQRMLVVPLMVGQRRLGELGVANREALYNASDEQLLIALAAQLAAAVDRLRLTEAIGENLSRRVRELDAISLVSNELTQTLELDRVLEVIRQEAVAATAASGSSLSVLRPRMQWHDADSPLIDHRLGEIGTFELADIERAAVRAAGETSITVDDYRIDDLASLPIHARSALATAFTYGTDAVGIIHLYSETPSHFDQQSATFVQTLAAKASLGYANALRYQENLDRSTNLRRRVQQLNQIFELGQILQNNTDTVAILEAIAYSVQQSVGFDVVILSMVEEDTGLLRRVTQAGMPLEEFEKSKQHTIGVEGLNAILSNEYRISESYFFPFESVQSWYRNGIEVFNSDFDGNRSLYPHQQDDWRDGDLLIVPLQAAGGGLLGVMSLDRPFDNKRPDRSLIEILEIFAHQASSTLENVRLYLSTVSSAEQEAQLNELMEAISSTLDIDAIAESVARGALRLLPLSRMTIALLDADRVGFDVLTITPSNDNSVIVQRDRRGDLIGTALGYTVETGEDQLYPSDADISAFQDLQAWREAGEHTALVVPLVTGGITLGSMHIGSDRINAFGFEEYRGLIKRIANLAAVAIQNARLFNQAVNLRAFNESVVESIQQGIVVLNHSGRILSFNTFIRGNFGWTDNAIQQDLFEFQPQLRFLASDFQSVIDERDLVEHLNQTTTINGVDWVQNFYLYPLLSGKTVSGVVVLMEDVTERTQLEADIAARANQLSALTEVSSRVTASLNRREVVDLALNEMVRIIDYDTMSLWRLQGNDLVLEGARGLAVPSRSDARVTISDFERVREMIEDQRPHVSARLEDWEHLPGEDNSILSWLGVPIIRRGEVTGMIALGKSEEDYYDQRAVQAALTFANQVAVALANADLFAETQSRTERLSLLNRVSGALAQSLDMENILETGLLEMVQLVGIEGGRALSLEREIHMGKVVVEHPRGDFPPSDLFDIKAVPSVNRISSTGDPLQVEDVGALTEADAALHRELSRRGLLSYLGIPMSVGGQVIGIFELHSSSNIYEFDSEHINMATVIASQAAIAVQNANLLEQTLVRTRELETLLEAAQATSFTLDLEEVFQNVARLMIQALEMDNCTIFMYDPVEDHIEVQIDLNKFGDLERMIAPGTRYELPEYPARHEALTLRRTVVIRRDDAVNDADPAEIALLEKHGDYSRMLVPLIVRDQSIGLISVEINNEYRSFEHREIRMAQALAAQAATAIENARLSTETAARVEELLVINDISRAISATMDISQMIDIVRAQVPNLTEAEEVYLALYDPEEDEITFPMAVRKGQPYEIPPRSLGDDEVSFVIRNRRWLPLGGDFSLDAMRRNLGIVNGEGEIKAYLGVPLISGDQVLGVLAVRNVERAESFGLNDQRILTTIGTQLGAAIQNAQLFNQIRSFAEELNERVQARTTELREERDRLDVLYRITTELGRTLDIDRVLESALQMVASAVRSDEAAILLREQVSQNLYTRATVHAGSENGETPPTRSGLPVDLANRLVRDGSAVVIDDLNGSDWLPIGATGDGWHSFLGAPLEINNDILGAIVFLRREVGGFNEGQLKLTTATANQIAAALNNAELYKLIRDQAERLGILLQTEKEEAGKSQAILEGIADGVMLADAKGHITLFNSAAEQILAIPRDGVLGQPVGRLMGVFGDSAARWLDVLTDWLGRPSNERLPEHFSIDRLDLGKRIINVNMSPVYVGAQLLGTVSVFRDITREVEVDRMKSEFISNVSHELRTPMTSIKGYADLLMMGAAGNLSERQNRFMDTIKSNTERLSILVNDLLNISKLDAGSDEMNIEQVDVIEIVNSALDKAQKSAEQKGKTLKVSTDLDPMLPNIQADAGKIYLVISNVIENAFNYTYDNGNVVVTVRPGDDEETILITVSDDGIGIPEEFQSRIWNRFERFDEHALVLDVAGTGLGLPIARTMVEMHNGAIWFTSEVNQGTTFYIALPIRQAGYELPVTDNLDSPRAIN